MGAGLSQDEASKSEASSEQKQVTNQAEPSQSTPTVKLVHSKPTAVQVRPCTDNEVKPVERTLGKYWVDKNSNNCFMLYSKELSITWVEDQRYWRWVNLKETSNELIEVAELLNVCWLEVSGKFNTSKLSPGTLYEVAFVIMLKDPAYGWQVPVNIKLVFPDGTRQESKVNLMEKVRGQWIKIPAGEFQTPVRKQGEIEFSMMETKGGEWKKGLVVKGVTIQPKSRVSE
ncbi:hypothetical protein FNV43_RR06115 [Rhamnella rubrinervis]|uniref:Uncharacterized protein n=1 Tax=Rhamnella rubrinervis TaxID=2594499 RepID=A0A8K0ML04_9ROSA|nr:hypothetical protein FNV43_RR06115 [Rhamnella rubrinervis]